MSSAGFGIISDSLAAEIDAVLAAQSSNVPLTVSIMGRVVEDLSDIQVGRYLDELVSRNMLREELLPFCEDCDLPVQITSRETKRPYCDICGRSLDAAAVKVKCYFVPSKNSFKGKGRTMAIESESCFTAPLLKQGQMEPWELLSESQFLYTVNDLGHLTEKEILARLQRHGFVLVRLNAFTPENALMTSLENMLGDACSEQNDFMGKIQLITPDPTKEAISGNSGKELAAHVDGTQDSPLPPAMLVFQYLAGATHGGESTFFDMAHVLSEFSAEDAAKILTDLAQDDAAECTKAKNQKDGSIWTKTFKGPLVRPVCNGHSVSVRVRFDRVMKIAPQYRESFEKLQTAVLTRGQAKRITFRPMEGDIAIFDNWRIMHGRLSVGGRHERHHNRVWLSELAERHAREGVLLGVRGLPISLLSAVKRANDGQLKS